MQMAMSELQMGLIGAGGLVVVSIFAFNKWQERKHRRQAEHVVVAIEPAPSEVRIEPGSGGAQGGRAPLRGGGSSGPRRVPPALPPEVDERADCVVRIESIEPVPGGRLLQSARKHLEGINRPVRWFGFADADNRWELLEAGSASGYHWICAALQLVDRRGAASDAELAAFCGGLQRMCDIVMGIPTLPAKGEAVERAAQLDRFCASVDIQIGVNIVARAEPISGARLFSLAEAAGLELRGDGCFHARDEAGQSQFVLGNMDTQPFAAEALRKQFTQGVTLTLDVPRVADGVRVFDRMMALARQLAEALNAVVVDDNRRPFGDRSAELIRGQIGQFQGQMNEQGVAPGSALAQRLFV